MVRRPPFFVLLLTCFLLFAPAWVSPARAQFVPARSYSYLRTGGHYSQADVVGGERNGWGLSPSFSRELSGLIHLPGSLEYRRSHQPGTTVDLVSWRARSGLGLDVDFGEAASAYLRTQLQWTQLESAGDHWNEVVGHYSTGLRYQALDSLELNAEVAYVDHDEEITSDASTNYYYSAIYYPNPGARRLVGGVGPFYRYENLGDVDTDIFGLQVSWYFR